VGPEKLKTVIVLLLALILGLGALNLPHRLRWLLHLLALSASLLALLHRAGVL